MLLMRMTIFTFITEDRKPKLKMKDLGAPLLTEGEPSSSWGSWRSISPGCA